MEYKLSVQGPTISYEYSETPVAHSLDDMVVDYTYEDLGGSTYQ